MPCCFEDKCLAIYTDTVETSNDIGNSCDDCSDDSCCSPFLHCNTCFGFPEARFYNPIIIILGSLPYYKSDYIVKNALSDYKSSIWQPPKA